MMDGNNKKTGLRHFSGDYRELFKDLLKQSLEIELDGLCRKLSVIEDEVYVLFYSKKEVNVYSVSGELVKTLTTPGFPFGVDKTAAGEMMVLCTDTGLHVLNRETGEIFQIAEGSYCDVCVCGDSVYTWDYKGSCVVEFVKGDMATLKQNRVISATWIESTGNCGTLLVKEGEDGKSKEFFIGAAIQHKVFQVNSQGDKVREFVIRSDEGLELLFPFLCGVDDQGQLLVVDYGHCKCKLIDLHTGHLSTVFSAESSVFDAKIVENTFWLSRDRGCQYVIAKYELSV